MFYFYYYYYFLLLIYICGLANMCLKKLLPPKSEKRLFSACDQTPLSYLFQYNCELLIQFHHSSH